MLIPKPKGLEKYKIQSEQLHFSLTARSIQELTDKFVYELRYLPSAGKKSLRHTAKARVPEGFVCDTTTYEYYTNFIFDTVRQIRSKHKAYVFSFSHIADVIAYERDADFKYLPDSDSFEVTLAS